MKSKLASVRIIIFLLLSATLISRPVSVFILKHIPYYLYFFFLSFCLSYSLIPVFHKLGVLLDVLDKPGGRKVHSDATPLLGGVAVFIAFSVLVNYIWGENREIQGLFYAVTIIAFMGIVDDIIPLSALFKLCIQIGASILLIIFGVKISLLPESWWGSILEYIFTVIWLVGITNAFNFLDGLDGLASGTAAVISFFFFLIAFVVNDYHMALIGIVLCGSVLAFIPFNMRIGKGALIFLGDAGSTFLGFSLAALAILGTWGKNAYIDLVSPVLLLSVPIFDMLMTTTVRIWTGKVNSFNEWLEYGGKDHFHHRLLKLGFSKKQTTVAIWAITAMLGCTSLMILKGGNKIALISLFQAFLLFGLISGIMIVVNNRSENN